MANTPFSFIKPELITEIAEQAGKLLPGEKSREELHRSLQVIVQNTLSKLDLVTREEFDAQIAVLHKTRAKLEQLEKEVEALTEKLEQQK